MFNRVITGIVGVAFALSLGACGANTGAGAGPEENVGASTEKLVYAHLWDTFEGGSNNGVAYRNQYFDPQATAELQSWGMVLAVEDYCANITPGSNPSCTTTNQTWVRVRYTPGGAFTDWQYVPDASVFFSPGTQWNDPGGLTISCERLTGNIFCTVGIGGPTSSAYIESKYGS
jgi:hypothetical protein